MLTYRYKLKQNVKKKATKNNYKMRLQKKSRIKFASDPSKISNFNPSNFEMFTFLSHLLSKLFSPSIKYYLKHFLSLKSKCILKNKR